jgi:type VI secretion system secreted protein Hcp
MSTGKGTSDIFLSVQTKRGGKVKGEATTPGHEEHINVLSWQWGVSAASSLDATAATARRSWRALSVTKGIDSATTSLMAALATNDEVKEAVLTMRRAGGNAQDYFTITLKEARLIQIEHSVAASGDTQEELRIAFRKVEVEYRQQEQSGGRGAASVFSDDIAALS